MVSTRSQTLKAKLGLEAARQGSLQPAPRPVRQPKPQGVLPIRRSARLTSSNHEVTISGRITKVEQTHTATAVLRRIRVSRETTEADDDEVEEVLPRQRRSIRRSLKVSLVNINYTLLPEQIRSQDFRLLRQQRMQQNFKGKFLAPPLYSYNNRYKFRFGHNPLSHTNFQGPSRQEQWEVYKLMSDDLKANFGKETFLDKPDESTNSVPTGPMHASDGLTVDNMVKVILSISTENSLAIKQHDMLCSVFTYTVDGTEVKGTIPNYHRMRVSSPEKLARALCYAGQHNIRQKAFHAILQEVYEQNLKRLAPGEIATDENAAGAKDFVPGLLSLDYLQKDGASKQERFDMLVRFDQIAVKTGCCLLCFNLKIPVFVVDTHVHRMTRSLGWIPEDCNDADNACMFLDTIMDEQLKFGLHQAFWHHRINCARCMPRANPMSLAYQQRICPLEDLINRDLPPMAKTKVIGKYSVTSDEPKPRRSKPKELTTKKLATSVNFLKIHHKIAAEKGYVLRRHNLDDNFGDGKRQNKDEVGQYWWGLQEFAHANDIVNFDVALKDVGLTVEEYEKLFVKKPRTKKTKAKTGAAGADIEDAIIAESDSELSDLEEDNDTETSTFQSDKATTEENAVMANTI